MKKFKSVFLLLVMAALAWAPLVLAAADVSLSPANVNAESGKTFAITIGIDPRGESVYTSKLELNFPPELIEIKSFAFSSGWMPVSQAGYDLIDNLKGVLIKTAGYPGGASLPVTFGTITFSAKKAGAGVIDVGSDSLALNVSNQNVLAGNLNQVSVQIIVQTPAQAYAPIYESSPKPQQAAVPESKIKEQEANEAPGSSQAAAAIEAKSPTAYWILSAAVLALLAFAAGIFVGRKTNTSL